jgi:hypothetical protein
VLRAERVPGAAIALEDKVDDGSGCRPAKVEVDATGVVRLALEDRLADAQGAVLVEQDGTRTHTDAAGRPKSRRDEQTGTLGGEPGRR